MEGQFGYADGARGTITGDRRLTVRADAAGGRVVWDWNARTGTDYRKMPADLRRPRRGQGRAPAEVRTRTRRPVGTAGDRDRVNGEPRYLELSRRLFDDPCVSAGDEVELRGEAGPVGVYVTEVAALRTGR